MRLLTHRWFQVVLLLALLVGAVLLRFEDPPSIKRMRELTFDVYNRILPRVPANDVLIVDIDEESIKAHGQWPWPRTLVGDIPVILREMGAKAVVFDIVFSEPDRTSPAAIAATLPQTEDLSGVIDRLKSLPDNDAVMAEKFAQAGSVVTGFVATYQATGQMPVQKAQFINDGAKPDPLRFALTFDNVTATLPNLTHAAAGNGSFSTTPENDGIVRSVPMLVASRLEGQSSILFPSLSLEAVRVAFDKSIYKVKSNTVASTEGLGIRSVTLGDFKIPTDATGKLRVYYAGHRPEIYVPATDVLSRKIAPERVRGKIVLVGTSAIGLLDLRSSPLNPVLPGVEVHAEIIEQILHNKFLQRPDFLEGAEIIAAVMICLVIIFLAPFIGTGLLALACTLMIAGGSLGGLYAYQKFGFLIDPVYPSVMVITIFILSSILTNLRTEMEKRAVRAAFSHYISPVLMEELASNPDKLKLGGEVRDLSIMFTDIRNFTTISQGMDPADLIKMMNDFLTPMTSCVLDNRGTVDKYMGDAMMAFWNAPLDDADHARNACTTALAMVAALQPVNDALRDAAAKSGKTFRELKAGIGINSGAASVGNMGSKQRFAYSALGDTVNLASRIEGQTKGYGVSVMISEATRMGAPEFAAIEIDLITVKGRTEPVRVFALLGTPEDAKAPAFVAFAARHQDMLAAYRAGAWDDAIELAQLCANDRPDIHGLYHLFQERIAEYKQTPPPENWGGVFVAKDK